MKKSFLVVMVALVVVALVPQTLSAGVGLKGGYSWSKFAATNPPPVAAGYLSNVVGGLYFDINLGLISLQPEVLYTRMGVEYSEAGESLQYRLDCIQVPVLLKINVIPAGPLRPFIAAGGYGAYVVKAKGVMLVDGVVTDEGDVAETFKKYDYGAVGGAGLAFRLPGISITVEGRYNLGLANILRDALAGESVKNRSIMALVGIGF